MNVDRFSLDTNILIYAHEVSAGPKHIIARDLVDRAVDLDCRLTLQAMSEFYAATTRKAILTRTVAARQVDDWMLVFPMIASSSMAVRTALAQAVDERMSYWDALLVATAAEGGCTHIISEDMADGEILAGATILNPFDGDRLSRSVAELLA